MRPVVIAAVLGMCAMIGACGSEGRAQREAESVVRRWLAAERDLDGGVWCSLFDRRRLAKEEANARAFSRRTTCAELASARGPGLSAKERAELRSMHREVTEGARVESAEVSGHVATVLFSWREPKHHNPDISNVGVARLDGQYFDQLTLRLEHGQWRIGLARE